MATLSHSESRRLYSWWWDSHTIPKNSKWLQENLTDIDGKVKAMIKLIEEDADSFARRAEMYYKKRPELMKLVEEFYRAYRALAERYDHATGELRQAHRTMAEAFPNQVPYVFADESPSGSSGPDVEPHTPEMPHPIHALFVPDDLYKDALGLSSTNLQAFKSDGNTPESDSGINKRGLKQLTQLFSSGDEGPNNWNQLTGENESLKTQVLSQSERAAKAETEVEILKKTLAVIQAEKNLVLQQYQQSLEKLSKLGMKLSDAQKAVGGLNEQASKTDIEIKILKEALLGLESERDAGLLQYNRCLERISSLEAMLSFVQGDAKGLNERAVKAETEAQNLKQELFKLEAEKESCFLRYKQCLAKMSALEGKISDSQENVKRLSEEIERADGEVNSLKESLASLKEEKEAAALQYKQCMETVVKMESQISHAEADAKRLNGEILSGAEKLKSAEEQCVLLERSNRSLRLEAETLVKKITKKDYELSEKNDEMEKLHILMQEEHLWFVQVEATLQALQKLHSQSQEEQKALAMEFKNCLQMLKDMEIHQHSMEDDIQRVKEDNESLSELNLSCTTSTKNLQDEIFNMKEMKEKLEQEVALKSDQSNVLEQHIFHVEEEIKGLSRRYQAMVEQVESVGLNPECLESSVRDLQNEKSKLEDICARGRSERDLLYEKLKDKGKLSKENAILESSLLGLNGELEGLRWKVKELLESCQFLQGEKSTLVAEKAILLSQLQIITQNMQKLFEKNTLLESSLSGANIELERLRARSKSLEDLCQFLNNEKTNLLTERDTLAFQLTDVEHRLQNLEKRFTKLERKYSNLEKEKGSTLNAVEELRGSLHAEKRVRASYIRSSEARLAGLENNVHLMQEERVLGKKEFEEELDKAVNAQLEIFILQKFIEDLEEKNLSLFIECQRHVEKSKLSDKLISELESENLELQVEEQFLVEDIEKLRLGIHQVFRALQVEPGSDQDKIIVKLDQVPMLQILKTIKDLKTSLFRSKDEEQKLLVEKSVLLTLFGQMGSEGAELASEKQILEREYDIMADHSSMLQKEKHELLEIQRQLRLEVTSKEQKEEILEAQMETLQSKLANLQDACIVLQEENSKVLEDRRSLLKKLLYLKEEKEILEEENSVYFHEALAFNNLSLVLESFTTEKVLELKAVSEDLNTLFVVNDDLKEAVGTLEEDLERKEVENLHLNETVQELFCKVIEKDIEGLYLNETVQLLDKKLCEAKDSQDQLHHQILAGKNDLKLKTIELAKVEEKLRKTEELNVELRRTFQELSMEHEDSKLMREKCEIQILELSRDNSNQKKEIESLCEANESLKNEVGILSEVLEEHRIREENLSSELQERSNDFQVWEAEATSFYFDLQHSAVREAFLENKVHELTDMCESFKDESVEKGLEVERMKERVSILESEVGGLMSQLSAYVAVVASLGENVASLQHNAALRKKFLAAKNQQYKDVESPKNLHQKSFEDSREDGSGSTLRPDRITELEQMQTMIKEIDKTLVEETESLAIEAIEKALVEELERLATQESTEDSDIKVEASAEIEELASNGTSFRRVSITDERVSITDENLKLQRTPDNGTLMKDIPLDHVSNSSLYGRSRSDNGRADDQLLVLWKNTEQYCRQDPATNERQNQTSAPEEDVTACHQFANTQPMIQNSSELQAEKELGVDRIRGQSHEGKKEKVLERLASDSQKLMTLQTTAQDLNKKMETIKKGRKANGLEYETVKTHLHEVKEAVLQLVEITDKLKKKLEESPSLDDQTSIELDEAGNVSTERATEQASEGSEKIERLQFELQNIDYILLKLEVETKKKGRSGFYDSSRTGVLMRDLIYSGRSGERRKKVCVCGCMRPSTNGD